MGKNGSSHKKLPNIIFLPPRSYVKEQMYGEQIMNKTVDNAYFHTALIHESLEASCVTFQPQHRLPPGQKYGVFLF